MSTDPAPSVARGDITLQPSYFTSSLFVNPLRQDIVRLIQTYAHAYLHPVSANHPNGTSGQPCSLANRDSGGSNTEQAAAGGGMGTQQTNVGSNDIQLRDAELPAAPPNTSLSHEAGRTTPAETRNMPGEANTKSWKENKQGIR